MSRERACLPGEENSPVPGKLSVKPPKFAYARPAAVEEALVLLAEHGEEAKVLAGGQSLLPLLNFRLLQPSVLLDINRLTGLQYLQETTSGGLRIGALTRHFAVETSPLVRRLFPIVTAAVAKIGHLAIRNRGTVGGSLSHADPAAEWPLLALLLDASLKLRSSQGERSVPASAFIAGALCTTLAPAELVTEVELPAPRQGTGWGFEEFSRRSGGFAIAAAGILMRASMGRAEDVRIVVLGGADGPQRVGVAEDALCGRACDAAALDDAVHAMCKSVEANVDLQASAELRRRLMGTMLRRAAAAAWRRANERVAA